MDLQERIDLMAALGTYMQSNDPAWIEAKELAFQKNPWFIPEFISTASTNIADNWLKKENLSSWAAHYHLDNNIIPRIAGIVMAGNIPMVGFHDMLAVFLSGHIQKIKFSSKDNILLTHLIEKLYQLNSTVKEKVIISDRLTGCDAFIATGSNTSATYFKEYFGKYPHIIRSSKTSVGILDGTESESELNALTDDIHLYFGRGCRNVTKIHVPEKYDFVPLLNSFNRYKYFSDHHKYNNNYDYQLSIRLINGLFYMTNGSLLVIENEGFFPPISILNYSYYSDRKQLETDLKNNDAVQCIIGKDSVPFGRAQQPAISDYADGIDTMEFLLSL